MNKGGFRPPRSIDQVPKMAPPGPVRGGEENEGGGVFRPPMSLQLPPHQRTNSNQRFSSLGFQPASALSLKSSTEPPPEPSEGNPNEVAVFQHPTVSLAHSKETRTASNVQLTSDELDSLTKHEQQAGKGGGAQHSGHGKTRSTASSQRFIFLSFFLSPFLIPALCLCSFRDAPNQGQLSVQMFHLCCTNHSRRSCRQTETRRCPQGFRTLQQPRAPPEASCCSG